MKKTTAIILLIVLISTLSAGCISTETTHTKTITTTEHRIILQTSTTIISTTKTYSTTTTITKTTTTTETYTTYVTVTTTQNTLLELYNSIIISPDENAFYSVTENGLTVLYIPTRYWVLSGFFDVLYSVMNTNYYSYLDSVWKIENIPPLPTGTNIENYATVHDYFTNYFTYDEKRAATVDPFLKSYFPHELARKKGGICGDYAVMYAAWYIAHSHTVKVHAILFDSYSIGHAWIDNGEEGLENQYVGVDTQYISAYWYRVFGPYTEYVVTIGPSGIIGWKETHVTKEPPVPLQVNMKKITYTAYITVTESLTLTLYGYYNEKENFASVIEYSFTVYNNTLSKISVTTIVSSGAATIIIDGKTTTTNMDMKELYPPELPYADVDVFTHHKNTLYFYPESNDELTISRYEVVNSNTITVYYTLKKDGITKHMVEEFIYREIP